MSMKNNTWRLVAILLLACNTGFAATWQGDDVTCLHEYGYCAIRQIGDNISKLNEGFLLIHSERMEVER